MIIDILKLKMFDNKGYKRGSMCVPARILNHVGKKDQYLLVLFAKKDEIVNEKTVTKVLQQGQVLLSVQDELVRLKGEWDDKLDKILSRKKLEKQDSE